MLRDEISYITNALSLDWEPEDPANPNPGVEARIPLEKLPVLLHELTHSQCFLGVVGETFGYLWRLILSGTKLPQVVEQVDGGAIPLDFLRLLQNLAAGIRIYEPWIEGLALFAEWDGLPGDSAAASKAMLNTSALYFMGAGVRPDEAIWQRLANDLTRARLLGTARPRKTNLLSVGLDDPKSYYLAGYLGVKALYGRALTRSHRLLDKDLFCSFTSLVLFSDPVAATILLDVDEPFPSWLARIEGRLRERLKFFETADLDARVQKHEFASVAGSLVSPQLIERMDAKPLPDDLEGAIARHEEIRREMDPSRQGNDEAAGIPHEAWDDHMRKHMELLVRFTPKAGKERAAAHRRILQTALKHRAMIRLRRKSGTAQMGAEEATLVDASGKVIAKVDKDSRVPTGSTETNATYVFYFYPQLLCFLRVMYVMHPAGPKYIGVTCYSRKQLSNENIDLLREAIIHNERLEYIRSTPGAEEEVWKIIDRCLTAEEAEYVRARALAIGLSPLLGHLDSVQRRELTAKMSKFGIFGWLSRAPAIVEAATLLSLLPGQGLSMAEVRDRFREQGADWDALSDVLGSFARDHKVQLQQELDVGGVQRLLSAF